MDFKIAFFNICDLSAARYSAAMGVDYAHFNFDQSTHFCLSETEFSIIYPLISGPEILISYGDNQILNFARMGLNAALLHPIFQYDYKKKYSGLYSLVIGQEEKNIRGQYKNIFAKSLEIYVWLIEEGYENVYMPISQFSNAEKALIALYKPHGIYIKLPKEIEVGMADYSAISDFLDLLEAL